MKTNVFTLSFVLLLARISGADDVQPGDIFKKVETNYKSMDTYSADGKVTADLDMGAQKMTLETNFSIKLKKPNLYLISWQQKNSMTPAFIQSGAVWSDGSQPYLYMGVMKAYSKLTTDEMALASATGVSGGAAFTVPSLFLPSSTTQPSPFSRLEDPKREDDAEVDGEDCYVISGSSPISKKETWWITKKDHLIEKYARNMEPPERGFKAPELTDEQLESAIKGLGQEVTEERKQAMRKIMKQAQDNLKTTKLKGDMTESQSKIVFPKFVEGDFDFKVPEGTVLKDSLFGGLLNPKPPEPKP